MLIKKPDKHNFHKVILTANQEAGFLVCDILPDGRVTASRPTGRQPRRGGVSKYDHVTMQKTARLVFSSAR